MEKFRKNNSGYDGMSKSKNAVYAEEQGLFPISVIAKQVKLETDTIKKFFMFEEWHHTSGFYNETKYYNLAEIKANITDEVRAYDKQVKAAKKQATIHNECTVEWLEWSGKTGSKPVARKAENATVKVVGKTAYFDIEDSNGNLQSIKKRIDSNGFSFISKQMIIDQKNAVEIEQQNTTNMFNELIEGKEIIECNNLDFRLFDNTYEYFGVFEDFKIITNEELKHFLKDTDFNDVRYSEQILFEIQETGFLSIDGKLFTFSDNSSETIKQFKAHKHDLFELDGIHGNYQFKEYVNNLELLKQIKNHFLDNVNLEVEIAGYFDNFERKDNEIVQINSDVSFTSTTKKEFVEGLINRILDGDSYAIREANDLMEKGYARSNLQNLVIASNDNQKVKDSLNPNRANNKLTLDKIQSIIEKHSNSNDTTKIKRKIRNKM